MIKFIQSTSVRRQAIVTLDFRGFLQPLQEIV